MSAERELLEQAAKAAGYQVFGDQHPDDGLNVLVDDKVFLWRPRTDDGDALRLAVKLGIERIFVLRLGPNGVCVDGAQEPKTAPVFEHSLYRVAFDPYDATRLAIVRAAASIGRAMP